MGMIVVEDYNLRDRAYKRLEARSEIYQAMLIIVFGCFRSGVIIINAAIIITYPWH
jgi:hypothetical protein